MRSSTKNQEVGRNIKQPNRKKLEDMIELAELGKKAGVVFHDLANHITALTLSIGYLEDSFARDSERLREYSKKSEKTRIQMEYVAKILRAHIEREREHESKTIFNPADEIKAIVKTFESKALVENIKFICNLDKEIKIRGGVKAFFHTVTNLVSNAIESFSGITDRNRTITLSLNKTNQKIVLSVADNGAGIDPSNIGKIFDSHFTTKKNGHGIGLSATKEFVEKTFSGKITVESSASGTLFSISIPGSANIQPSKIARTQRNQNRKRSASPVLIH